jgi:hypothetical protein
VFSPQLIGKRKPVKCLDYGQVTANLKDFLSDLTVNLLSVELHTVYLFAKFIDGEFIEKIFANLDTLKDI